MKMTLDKYGIASVSISILLILFGIISSVNIIFVIDMIIFVSMMFFCYRKIEERSILFAFGTAFFVFLLGREFLQVYFHYEVEAHYALKTNNHAYFCIFLALIGVWSFYAFSERTRLAHKRINGEITQDAVREDSFIINVRALSKMLFYATMPFALGMRIVVAAFVRGNGYLEYYTGFVETMYSGNTVLYLIGQIENILPVAFGIFLSTFPRKKEAKIPIIVYFFYLVVSLSGGIRGTFVLGILYIFVFVTYMQSVRPEEHWFQRKQMAYLVLLLPILAVAGTFYGVMRFGTDVSVMSLLQAFISFFYDQGGIITLIKHAYELENSIPKQGPYLLEFLHSGLLARLFGFTVYHGNTVEHALHGGSFQHAIAYVIMGAGYLAGNGTGSCYIAELYYDLRYIGVFLGSGLYGWIFCKISNDKTNSQFIRSLIWVLLPQFLWAPRGPYTGFISFIFAPATLVSFIMICGGAKLLSRKSL